MTSQNEESSHRRYSPKDFPLPLGPCNYCYELVWSDQGQAYVKGENWNDKIDVVMALYHDDCFEGKPAVTVKRDSNHKLESKHGSFRSNKDS